MARAGEELTNTVTGLRTVFRTTATDSGGELLQVDWIGEPRWSTGPDHVHRLQEERFEVLAGRLGLRIDGAERTLAAGEAIVAAAGVPHAAWNAGEEEEVHVLVDFRPALRTETAFEALAGLARDGKTTKTGVPRNPLQAALILREFADEFALASPPPAIQRIVLAPLAAVGRLVGLRAEYPYAQATP